MTGRDGSLRRAAALLLLPLLSGCGAPAATGAVTATPEDGQPVAPAPLAWPDPLPPASPDVGEMHKGLAAGTWAPAVAGDFDEAFIDEAGLRSAYTNDRAGRRTWRGFSASGTVRLDSLIGTRTGEEVAYLYSLVQRASLEVADYPDVAAVLHLRHRGRVRAWLDGQLVLDEPASADWAEARAPIVLTGPFDVLLLKCARGSAAFGPSLDVEVRVSAPDGTPLAGAAWNTMRPGGLPSDL